MRVAVGNAVGVIVGIGAGAAVAKIVTATGYVVVVAPSSAVRSIAYEPAAVCAAPHALMAEPAHAGARAAPAGEVLVAVTDSMSTSETHTDPLMLWQVTTGSKAGKRVRLAPLPEPCRPLRRASALSVKTESCKRRTSMT
jgi:hypothetical protein